MTVREFYQRATDVVVQAWRKSLTFRFLLATGVLTTIVVVIVSLVTLTQVRDGLVEQRQESAITTAQAGLLTAIRAANSLPIANNQADRAASVDAIVAAVAAPAGTSGSFEVLLLATPGKSPTGTPERGTNQISDTSIPVALRSSVDQEQSLVWQISQLEFLDGQSTPGIVVGAPIYLSGIGQYELYQLFPLSQEIETLALTSSSIAWSGLVMIVALIVITLFLTRQIIGPIRQAAESAERLRSGRLTERLAVRGEDELARLADSFNQMAVSLQEQIRQLERVSKVQQRFVSDVSHELRTPLTTIRMASELLYASSDDFDPSTARAVELLQQQSERFENLLNDLLEISRIDAGTAKVELEEIHLLDLVERVLDSLSAVIEKLDIDLELMGLEEVGIIHCDVRRTERIVRNLISNAIEHAQGQLVVIAAGSNNQSIALSVRDYGVGLQPGESSLVFNRFWRADPSRQRTLGGTGLGLAISLEDARVQGGWLDADGVPQGGAHFRLTLPRAVGNEITDSPLPLSIAEIDAWIGGLR